MDAVITLPIFQMRKLRLRKVKRLALGLTNRAKKW